MNQRIFAMDDALDASLSTADRGLDLVDHRMAEVELALTADQWLEARLRRTAVRRALHCSELESLDAL